MITRFVGALIRAIVMAFIIIVPSALVSAGASQAQMFTLTFAVLASSVIFVEYIVQAPAVIEFRFASPYNRLRFLMLATMAIVLSQGLTNAVLSGNSGVLPIIGGLLERMMSGWASPALHMVEALGLSGTSANELVLRIASFSICMAFFFTIVFGAYIWLGAWPLSKVGFNLWPNMPSFTARAGQKASTKILQVSILSFTLALTLPYLIPYFVRYGGSNLGINFEDDYLTIYWVLFLWSMMPAMALFRSISLLKLAFLAENIRKF